MIEDIKKNKKRAWNKFARRHWKMIMLWILLGAVFAVSAAYVAVDFAYGAVDSGLVPDTLDQWAVGDIFTFCLNLLFWLAVLIGIPLLITVIAIYILWWKTLPLAERAEYDRAKLFKSSDSSKGGSACSFFFWVLFMIKVWWDGNWWQPISTWEFDYVIGIFVWILLLLAIVIGIPVLLGGTWYITSCGKGKWDKDDDKPKTPGTEGDGEDEHKSFMVEKSIC